MGGSQGVQRVLGDRVHHRIRAQGVERRGDSDAEPAAARAGEASLCDEADDDHRPARLRALCTGFIRSISGSSGYSGCFACGRVVADEYRALLGALLVVLILLLFASAGMYLLERDVQPDKFGSKLLYTRTFMPGVPMVRAHDAGDAMFIIASGEAIVETGGGHSATLKEGDFFGE